MRLMNTLSLDHVGVIVGDLDNGQEVYKRLGFRLTARSFHSGSRDPGDPVTPWGSGNHCAMFKRGYLEIMGIHDPQMYSSATAMLAKYEGTHIVAMGWDNADAGYALLSNRAPGVRAPATLERDAPFGIDDSQSRRARFRNTKLDPQLYPEASFLFIEHMTRDVLWQPHLLDHPNGAVAIQEAVIASAEPDDTCARLAQVLGQAPLPKRHGGHAFTLANGALLYVLPASEVSQWARGVAPPALPCGRWVGGDGKRLGCDQIVAQRQ